MTPWRPGKDWPFIALLSVFAGGYAALLLAMLVRSSTAVSVEDLLGAMASREIRHAIGLSLVACTITAGLSLVIATPIAYVLSRFSFRGRTVLDTLFDIPLVLPPLVVGLFLLLLFQTHLPGGTLNDWLPITYTAGAVIVAQTTIGCAFALRTMRSVFDQLGDRGERVAMTLGCNRWQAFRLVALPAASRGMVAAATLVWARSMGEFGPILVFAGATRQRTEVLPTTVFLELSIGNVPAAVAVSLLMVVLSIVILLALRICGERMPR